MTERVPEPGDGDERDLLLGWLAFHRSALEAKCGGLTDDQLVARSAPPSPLSLLGLVRHLSEMERVYGVWGNACQSELVWVWGPYDEGGPEPDIDCDASQVVASMRAWGDEKASTDGVIRNLGLDDSGGTGVARVVDQEVEGAPGLLAYEVGRRDNLGRVRHVA